MDKKIDSKNLIEEICNKCGKEISEFEKLLKAKRPKARSKTSCPSFNLIQELHIDNKKIYENGHTRILGAILKYNQQFLHSFLEWCCGNIYVQKTNVEVEIERQYEKGNNGVWQKGNSGKREGSNCCRPDCLIWKKDHFAVVIENKINGASETPHQVDNYIEAISCDQEIFSSQCEENKKKIWVIYLGGDTAEMPSKYSLDTNDKLFLIMDKKNRQPGKHLCLVSYKDVIIPWLEEDVLPICPFGMSGLTGGIMVYIDYLKHRFEDNLSEEEKFYDTTEVVNLLKETEKNLKPFYYERYIAVSNYLADNYENPEKKDSTLRFIKALRHYYLNYYFRFSNPQQDGHWIIRTTGAFVHVWKKEWERIQDKPHSTCDLYFQLYPYQIDNYMSNPEVFKKKKRAVTCCLYYKGKNDKLIINLNQKLKTGHFSEIGNYIFNKKGSTLTFTSGSFFDSFVADDTIIQICNIIDEAIKENM